MKKILFFIFICFFSATAYSMKISQVKGQSIIIDLQGSTTSVGQKIILMNAQQKKVGIASITAIKNGKALAKITSGLVTGSETLVLWSAKQENAKTEVVEVKPAKPVVKIPYKAAVVVGLSTNTLSAKVTNGTTVQNVEMTGNSIGVAGTYDRRMNSWLTLRGLLGYEQFNAIGAATINGCDNQTSKDCKTDIKYITTGAYGRYDKEFSPFSIWAALGLNVKVPISKSSNVIVESSLGSTMSYGVAIGVDYMMSDSKMYIPAFIEKQFYLKSDSAEASVLILRVGLGKEF